jgi:hypothetical protein
MIERITAKENRMTETLLFTRRRRRENMRHTNLLSRAVALSLALALVCVVAAVTSNLAVAQSNAYSAEKSTALKSRAEREAEQSVALSPDKIIELLRQEPGLLLQVKKMLVRKAYEQGRILDPEDLTDEALFELLREDHNICVLATREIEDRAYVRAKPTKEEIEHQRELDAQYGVTRTSSATPAQRPAESTNPKAASQEDAYWEKHEGDTAPYAAPQRDLQPNPNAPMPANPQPLPAENSSRQVEMTSLPPTQDVYDGMGVDYTENTSNLGQMARATPEQLPGILNTSASASSNLAMLDGSTSVRGRSAGTATPNYGSNPSSAMNSSLSPAVSPQRPADGRGADMSLQASLEMPRRQLPSAEDLNLDRP